MSVEAPTFDPATDPATQAAAGIPHQRSGEEAPFVANLDPSSEYLASRAALDAFQASLGQPRQEQGDAYAGLTEPMSHERVLDVNANVRGRTEDDMVPGSQVAEVLHQGEKLIGEQAEARFREKYSSRVPRDEGDLLDRGIQERFSNAAKEAGRRAVHEHRATINDEIKRNRAEEAAKAERQRIEEESYKARQERDQLFFDGERADDWDKKVQALDSAFGYALAHEDDPRAMDDYNTYWGRLRAGERKAYDAYREKIENPTAPDAPEHDQPEVVTPPTPDRPQPGRRRTAERTQDSDQMTDVEFRERYQRKPRVSEVREAKSWRNRVPKLARNLGKLANEKLRMWNKAELPEEALDSLDDGEFITGPNANPEAAAHYRINGNGDYVAPERAHHMSPKQWAKHVIGLLTPQGPNESDRDHGRRISEIYKQDRAGWRARSREVGGDFDANHVATLFTNDLLAVERMDLQHKGQAQHRVWKTENLLGGLVEDFQLTPVEAGAAIARLVSLGVIQPVPGHPDQYMHEGGSISEVGGTF